MGDGRFLLATQNADCGTWQNTTLAQFVAQTLDLDFSAIDVIHMDTDDAPDDLGSAASRVTFMAGAAAIDASNELMMQVRELLALNRSISPEGIKFIDDGVQLDQAQHLSWAKVVAITGPLKVNGHHKLDQPLADPKTGYGNYSATYAFGAQATVSHGFSKQLKSRRDTSKPTTLEALWARSQVAKCPLTRLWPQ